MVITHLKIFIYRQHPALISALPRIPLVSVFSFVFLTASFIEEPFSEDFDNQPRPWTLSFTILSDSAMRFSGVGIMIQALAWQKRSEGRIDMGKRTGVDSRNITPQGFILSQLWKMDEVKRWVGAENGAEGDVCGSYCSILETWAWLRMFLVVRKDRSR